MKRDTSLDGVEDMVNKLFAALKSAPMESAAAKQFIKDNAGKQPSTKAADLAAIVKAQQQVSAPPVQKPVSRKGVFADTAQAALDAVGVADPTGIADGINAAWSLGRAIGDPERRGEHLGNAAISAVSMIPYIGDTAKLLKTGRYAKTASRLSKLGEGATAAEKAASREQLRDTAGVFFQPGGAPQESAAGFYQPGGAPVPPPPPVTDDEAKAAQSFTEKINSAAEGLSKFLGPIGMAGVKVAAFLKGLELMNAGVIGLNRELAPYNGQLSAAYAKFDADELQRNVRKGDSLSGPLSALTAEQSELKDTLASFTVPMQSVGISLLAVATKGVNFLIESTFILGAMAKTSKE